MALMTGSTGTRVPRASLLDTWVGQLQKTIRPGADRTPRPAGGQTWFGLSILSSGMAASKCSPVGLTLRRVFAFNS